MKNLKEVSQEQDKLFDEKFLTELNGDKYFTADSVETDTSIKEMLEYIHTRDLAIENSVRAELVEQTRNLLREYEIHRSQTTEKTLDHAKTEGAIESLHNVLALLTTSPSP